MSEFRIDDYIAGAGALLIMFLVAQIALYLGRHAHIENQQHKD
ncbi:MAG TPA: hypothetical protein VEH51_16960 [Burkholderiales bacterium]|nr:hypothetical protein [Burkholderiales bacterium]